jgi:hypothetical protein
MPDQMYVFRKPQISLESVAGTQTTPSKTLGTLEITAAFDPMVGNAGPLGYLVPTIAATNYEDTKVTIKNPSNGQMAYDEMPYLQCGLINNVSPTTPGGATFARDWTTILNDTSANANATFTFEVGDTVRAARAGYMTLVDGTWSVDFDKGLVFSGAGFAQKMLDDKYRYLRTTGVPTGGTITITATLATAITGALQFNDIGATLQALLRALPTIGATGVTVSGSAGGPWVVTFAGELAAKNVPLITLEANNLTGGTNPSLGIVMTTPGVDGGAASVQTLTLSGTPTGGNVTLGFKTNSTTTPAIVFNSSAAALQTALLAMPLFTTGDVVVTGGPLPAVETLAVGGQYANAELPVLTVTNALTGGTAPTATLTRLAPGATSAPLIPILGSQFDYFLATTMAGLSTATVKQQRVFGFQIKVGKRYGPVKPLNTSSNGTYTAIAELKPELTVSFSVGADAEGFAWLSALRVNTMLFVRQLATGPLIEAGFSYFHRDDMAILLTKVNPIKEGQGLAQIDFEGVIGHDGTSGTSITMTTRCALTAL